MRDSLKSLIVITAVYLIGAGALIYGCWRLERWLNWKYDYSARVEQRVRGLEKRIESLEAKRVVRLGGIINSTPVNFTNLTITYYVTNSPE